MYCKKKDAAKREQREKVRSENDSENENDKSKHTKHHRDVGHSQTTQTRETGIQKR